MIQLGNKDHTGFELALEHRIKSNKLDVFAKNEVTVENTSYT